MHLWAWPTTPWEQLNIDFAGPIQGTMLFIAVDAHSKWPEVIPMSSTTTAKTIALLQDMFSCFGIPHEIEFKSGP